MALPITEDARAASEQTNIQPNIVMTIDGVDTVFGAVTIQEFVEIGDDNEIGDPDTNDLAFFIGGLRDLPNQSPAKISFEKSSQTIKQQLQVDKGVSSSVSALSIAVIDKGEAVTQLITPDDTQTPTFDLLNRKVRIFYGFTGTAWPEDFVTIFRGRITSIDSGAGIVKFNLRHPDDKKRAKPFKRAETQLDGAITDSATVITIDDRTDFKQKITGPDGVTIDAAYRTFVRIDDEVIEYESIDGSNMLQTVTRGALGTTAAAHDDDADVTSFYQIEDTVLNVYRKMLFSGKGGPWVEDVEFTAFNVTDEDPEPNSLFFLGGNLVEDFGVAIGDFITTTGAANGANNVSDKEIIGILDTEAGQALQIDGVTFVNEGDTSATVSFRSQYDTLGDGFQMDGDEVDSLGIQRIENLFLSGTNYRVFLKDTVDGREFLEENLLAPVSAYGLPRKSRVSVGFHVGPIPGAGIVTLDNTNVTNASRLTIKRSTERNFFSDIIIRFEEDVLEEDDDRKFNAGNISTSADSLNQVDKQKSLIIDAVGLRRDLQGESIANSAALRRLDRYQFGAETLTVDALFRSSFTVEIGDIVLLDGSNLKISDINNGSREFAPRFFEVSDRTFNLRTGKITLALIDTNFDAQGRFALISPCSPIKSGVSTTQFVIEAQTDIFSPFGVNEFRKWQPFVPGVTVVVRNETGSVREVTQITNLSGNLVTVNPALSFTPSAGQLLEPAEYDETFEQRDDFVLIFGHMTDNATFPDGSAQYLML